MKTQVTVQIVDCTPEEVKVKSDELQRFAELLGMKFHLVEDRHYTDTYRATLTYTRRHKAFLRLNALTAYCALKGTLCRVDFSE